MYILRSLLLCFIINSLGAVAEAQQATSIATLDSVLESTSNNQEMDANTKARVADSIFHLASEQSDVCLQVKARVHQGTQLDNIGQPDSALVNLFWANDHFGPGCDSATLMSLYAALTNVYFSLGDGERIDSLSTIALDLWNATWTDNDDRLAILNNRAIGQAMGGDFISSTATFHQALTEAEQTNNTKFIQRALINLGSIKGMTEDLDSAFYFLDKAAMSSRENTANYIGLLTNLAELDKMRKRYENAAVLLDSAMILAQGQMNKEMIANIQHAQADLYAWRDQYQVAYEYLEAYNLTREEYMQEERVRVVAEMMEKFESEKKARQIQQLEVEKLSATSARNRYMYIGIFVVLIALALLSRLNYVRRSRKAIQKEKEISEGLLLNILPASVAEELKANGTTKARHFQEATILFSDFQSFTTITEELTASDLVQEIHSCFKSFDEVMAKFGIEKIKTIGDAYMAATGITDADQASAADVVMAGIEIQQFIMARKKSREAQGLPAFEMRVGIHSGPCVAGIVGVKKFQYDLWGDTVNIASRMESNGIANHVNISEATYQLIRNDTRFHFTPRGLVYTKGKGHLEMYFVELTKEVRAEAMSN